MSGHTPGPWWFGIRKWHDDNTLHPYPKSPDYSGEGYSDNPYIHGADDTTIVGCDEYDVFGDCCADDTSRREADIRLILAAPELLEVARMVLGDFHDDTVYEAARAAIAKATGGAA